jgi:hypothetical protein
MSPTPDADMFRIGVLDEVFDIGVAPAAPVAFDDIVLETQFAGHAREFFCGRE